MASGGAGALAGNVTTQLINTGTVDAEEARKATDAGILGGAIGFGLGKLISKVSSKVMPKVASKIDDFLTKRRITSNGGAVGTQEPSRNILEMDLQFFAESSESCPFEGKTHGNSKASVKPQHGYEIYNNKTGDVVKTGISGQPLNKNGTSPRANTQINRLNKALGEEIYDARIVVEDMPNRVSALEWEKGNSLKLWNEGNSMSIHKRPKLW